MSTRAAENRIKHSKIGDKTPGVLVGSFRGALTHGIHQKDVHQWQQFL